MRLLLLLITVQFLLIGCKSTDNLISPPASGEEIRYSAIYIIHADANYLYHDEDGNKHRADEKVLAEAIEVGRQAEHGEIFIFHQKPERKILWLFPRKNRIMQHFRNGEFVSEGRYSPDFEEGIFSVEAELFKRNRAYATDSSSGILFYFGHEIPVNSGQGYHHSQKTVEVNADIFSEGIKSFLASEEEKFDLTVLSTCNNGNPQMANLMQPLTDIMLASPQNLHLSHFDTEALLSLEKKNYSAKKIASKIAENTFERLSKTLQTEITLFVYDMETAGRYLPDIDSLYRSHLTGTDPAPFEENIDCSELPAFSNLDFSDGVEGWHSSSQFGRRANSSSHSGWGCKR